MKVPDTSIWGSCEIKYPASKPEDRRKGWIIDPAWLNKQCKKHAEHFPEYHLSMEEMETMVLHFASRYPPPEREGGE